MIRLNDILDKVAAYNSTADLNLIRKAYVYCAKVHQGQTRLSGEPYIIHPMEVAGLLAELKLDVPSIITGFLSSILCQYSRFAFVSFTNGAASAASFAMKFPE